MFPRNRYISNLSLFPPPSTDHRNRQPQPVCNRIAVEFVTPRIKFYSHIMPKHVSLTIILISLFFIHPRLGKSTLFLKLVNFGHNKAFLRVIQFFESIVPVNKNVEITFLFADSMFLDETGQHLDVLFVGYFVDFGLGSLSEGWFGDVLGGGDLDAHADRFRFFIGQVTFVSIFTRQWAVTQIEFRMRCRFHKQTVVFHILSHMRKDLIKGESLDAVQVNPFENLVPVIISWRRCR